MAENLSRRAGTSSPLTITVPVTGMSCASCAISVEKTLHALPGVEDANVNFANQSALIRYQPRLLSLVEVQRSVRNAGYDLLLEAEPDNTSLAELQEASYRKLKTNTIFAFLFSIPVVFLAMFAPGWWLAKWIELALAAPVVFWFGRRYFVNAINQARHFHANMDTLVALSTGIAFTFSMVNTIVPTLFSDGMSSMGPPIYFESAAVVIAFISLGSLLEHRAKDRTSDALKKLIGLQPATVRIIRNGIETDVHVAAVQMHDTVVIRPGERVPVDGIVTSGSSYVDESMLTGEPVAVAKQPGSKVFAGTLNQRGSLTLDAQAVGSTTMLAQIIRRVEQAQGSKAPVEKLVDTIAGIFVPVVIGISFVTFAAWMLLSGTSFIPQALLASVTVLIIACPCALGLATPTALIVSMGKAADNGILIRDAQSLEITHKIDTVVLDKTGTITEGKPTVTSLIWAEEITEIEKYAAILYALERASEHPLAEAVARHFTKEGQSAPLVLTEFEALAGRGVQGRMDNELFYVGSARLLESLGMHIPMAMQSRMRAEEEAGDTIIYFFTKHQVLATISIGDPIKVGSREAIQSLRDLGIVTVMLTGDSKRSGKIVAKTTGVDQFEAELLPNEKGDYVRTLQKKGHIVAVIGDGINDSEALAQADVGIAMGAGTDIAMEVAHMTIISSDLRQVPKAMKLSRATVRTVKQNLFWAFIYNVIGIPIAAGVLYPFTGYILSPMIAGAAMALSSVSVVSNSLRLKRLSL
ncbi:MAG: heavy metal translocating P-type ATPase [Bacteroidota bacterium]|nr:heavy metal translocating P-type ATPase [Bacteroidota bacterium]MDP4234454.1 heavy metal translocating P-type ATPase [Bacteroidota bacterium]MDP4288186.1 heavy metal translocating P-type ATPase [Bacteroidota bacterium]